MKKWLVLIGVDAKVPDQNLQLVRLWAMHKWHNSDALFFDTKSSVMDSCQAAGADFKSDVCQIVRVEQFSTAWKNCEKPNTVSRQPYQIQWW